MVLAMANNSDKFTKLLSLLHKESSAQFNDFNVVENKWEAKIQ